MMLTARMPPSDELGFERYLRESYASLVARLRGRFSERVAAEDVVQEALLRAWQMDTRGERIRALEPWMTAVATNLARSRWRTMNAEDRALEKLAMDRSSDPSQVLQSPSATAFVGPVASMENRPIRGTTQWERYEVVLDVPSQAKAIALGVLLRGEGETRMAAFAVQTVGHEVQTTGSWIDLLPDRPQNLDFSGGLDL